MHVCHTKKCNHVYVGVSLWNVLVLALRTRVCAVSDHARENMAYKRSSADSAIEVAEDKVGLLSLEVGNEHTGRLVRHKLRVQTGA